ncbi:MAG: TIGR00269 family protein [Candidatus Bathyarchaeia archaeon]
MNEILCDMCHRLPAFYYRRFEGTRLCRMCFIKSVENKVRKTISEHRMLRRDDHVAVAVSGGKDSLTLLYVLKKIGSRFPDFKLSALTIDEGIKGYRDEAVRLAREFCEKMGVQQDIFSFKELFNFTLDEAVEMRNERHPCSLCGVLRRKAMEVGARKMGVTKLATAHNLDDELQTFFLNILHGEPLRMMRNKPVMNGSGGLFIPKIKPFHQILEREISLYAYINGIPFQEKPCPYAGSALRNDVRRFLDEMENRHPGLKYVAYRAVSKLKDAGIIKESFTKCVLSGGPSATKISSVCEITKT